MTGGLRSLADRAVRSPTFWQTVLPITVVAIVTSLATAYFLTGSPAFVLPPLATGVFAVIARFVPSVRRYAGRHPVVLATTGAAVFAGGPAMVLLLAPFVDILLLSMFSAVAGFWTGLALSVSARRLNDEVAAAEGVAPAAMDASSRTQPPARGAADLVTQEIAWPR